MTGKIKPDAAPIKTYHATDDDLDAEIQNREYDSEWCSWLRRSRRC